MGKTYLGVVVDLNDPLKLGRVRVRVNGFYDELETEQIPWARPKCVQVNHLDMPPLDSLVRVEFPFGGNVTTPVWFSDTYRKKHEDISDEDYPTASVLLSKNLSEYVEGREGSIDIRFIESKGLLFTYTYGDASNTLELRSDNSIFMQNNKTGKVVHVSNESISVGSETKSAEPMVLGNKNKEALDELNTSITSLFDKLNTNLLKLATKAASSPYTMHLVSSIKAMETELRTLAKQNNEKVAKMTPPTLSEVSTLD